MAEIGSSSGSGGDQKRQRVEGPVTRSRARAALSQGGASSVSVAVGPEPEPEPAAVPTLYSIKVVDNVGRVYPLDDYAADEPDRENWITGDGAEARSCLIQKDIPLSLEITFDWDIENPLENVPCAKVLGTVERLRAPDTDQQILNIGLSGDGGELVEGEPHRFCVTVNTKLISPDGVAFADLDPGQDAINLCAEINICDFTFVEVQLLSGDDTYVMMPPGENDPVVRVYSILDEPVRDNVADRMIEGTDRFVTIRHLEYACRWANGADGTDRNQLANNVIQRIRHYNEGDDLAALTFFPETDQALVYLSENSEGDEAADENNEGWNVLDRAHRGGDCTQQASLFADVFGLLGVKGTDMEIIRVFAYDTVVQVGDDADDTIRLIGKVRKGFLTEEGGNIWPVHGVFVMPGDGDDAPIVCDTSFSDPPNRNILTVAQALSVGEDQFIHSWHDEWRVIEETNPETNEVTIEDGSHQAPEQLDPYLEEHATEIAWRAERNQWLAGRPDRG